MPRRWTRLLPAAAWLALLVVPSVAQAFEHVTIGGGVQGVAGANFIDKPSDQRVSRDDVLIYTEGMGVPEYPGFAGWTSGFGFFLEVRAIYQGYLGLELDVFRTTDEGVADLKVTTPDGAAHAFVVEISHAAWHLPLLLKGAIPTHWVTPTIFIGPEFVVPDDDPEFGIAGGTPPTTAPQYSVVSDGYTMLAFGFGLEVNLKFIPRVDLRIPFTIRGGYNPGVEDERRTRANHTFDGKKLIHTELKTEWQYQVVGTLGLAAHF